MNRVNGKIGDSRRLWERPLGIPFGDDIVVDRVSDRRARQFYRRHHSYRPELDRVTVLNHGVTLDSHLVGAITYAMPRRETPIRGTNVADMIEVARVCVGADVPNLASCMLAKSQDRFMARWGARNGVDLLISMVRGDYDGTMFRALAEKGWENLRRARSAPSGNREYTGIEDAEKELWICPVADERETEQTTIGEATDDDRPRSRADRESGASRRADGPPTPTSRPTTDGGERQ